MSNGKGDRRRSNDDAVAYRENHDRIFGKKELGICDVDNRCKFEIIKWGTDTPVPLTRIAGAGEGVKSLEEIEDNQD